MDFADLAESLCTNLPRGRGADRGLVDAPAQVLAGREPDKLDYDVSAAAVLHTPMLACVAPKDTLRNVQASGQAVAMTGDGVNEVWP